MSEIKNLIFILFFFLNGAAVSSQIITVNNQPEPPADYSSFQQAHDNASPGDTILIYGSTTTYSNGGTTVNKPLTVIGPGYFLNENPETQVKNVSATFSSSIQFNPGSEGSVFIGLHLEGLNVNAPNIELRRNRITAILVNGNIDGLLIKQNFILSEIICQAGCSGLLVFNNRMGNVRHQGGATVSGIFHNNIIDGSFDPSLLPRSSEYKNNIFLDSNPANEVVNPAIDNTFSHNLFVGTNPSLSVLDGIDGNQIGVDPNLFVGLSGNSTDGQYQLSQNSVAIGAGGGGTDCGIFGGDDPYRLSGIPPIPTIFELEVPINATIQDGLNITIKAKANN